MTAYFRKSIKIAPGVHINLSKRGTGVSFGGRGAHVSFSPTGRVTKTVSIPGTGIYYRDIDTLHLKTKSANPTQSSTQYIRTPEEVVTPPVTTSVPMPDAHQVAAVEHHGFFISHGVAAFVSFLAAAIINIHYGSHPLNAWEPPLIVIGAISLILWLRDLAHTATERRGHRE